MFCRKTFAPVKSKFTRCHANTGVAAQYEIHVFLSLIFRCAEHRVFARAIAVAKKLLVIGG